MRKVRLGIIGPGRVTENAMKQIGKIAPSVEGINFYGHNQTSREKVKTHAETICQKAPDFYYNCSILQTEDFDLFMSSSDVLIFNVGLKTPARLIKGDLMNGEIPEPAKNFEQLESVVEAEARKTYANFSGSQAQQEELVADFITAYQVIKEINAIKKEGYFERPLRMYAFLPAILPVVARYAQKMKEYFKRSGEPCNSKLLIVNANSSENNLNAFLSVLPEMRTSSVSLAVDRERLTTICQTDSSLLKNNLALRLVDIGIAGDHDCYMVPVLEKAKIQWLGDQKDSRHFMAWLKQNFSTVYDNMRKEIEDYYIKRVGNQDMLAHAGDGLIDLIKSIFDGSKCTSGYFTELGSKPIGKRHGLKEGEGLCFVDEHRISWDGSAFKVIPERQELGDYSKELMSKCVEAHLRLHERLVGNPFIPVYGFPGSEAKCGQMQSPVQLISEHRAGKRKHLVAFVPVLYKNSEQKLIALDLGSGERVGEYSLGVLNSKEGIVRSVQAVEYCGELAIACGFGRRYLLLEPKSLTPILDRRIKLKHPMNPEGDDCPVGIRSIAAVYDRIFLAHYSQGLIYSDGNQEEVLFWDKRAPLRQVKFNPFDEYVYAPNCSQVHIWDSEGKKRGELFTGTARGLRRIAFDRQYVYASQGMNIQGDFSYYFSPQGDYGIYMDPVFTPIKGFYLAEDYFEKGGKTYLAVQDGNSIGVFPIKKEPNGKAVGVEEPKIIYQANQKTCITGMKTANDKCLYFTLSSRGENENSKNIQQLLEADLDANEVQAVFDFKKYREQVLTGITLVEY